MVKNAGKGSHARYCFFFCNVKGERVASFSVSSGIISKCEALSS
jgi:hypothetical protein